VVMNLHVGYGADGRAVRLKADERKTHMHVIGSSGSGKSKLLEWMIRGDLGNRQGFCLIDPHGTLYNDVLSYCAHRVLNRDIILLNLSSPDSVIGFNPFHRTQTGDVSVQVDRRIAAAMHAWNVATTDQTPTLERILRLVYTSMLEQDLGLPQVQHLIDFNAKQVREYIIGSLQSPLIQKEWREIQELRAADWRAETLSTKNRLFRLLSSPTLARFMGLPARTLNLRQIMDEGKVLLVNLAPSDHLSHENARVFGALLVNEFFEHALRRQRDHRGKDPQPFYLYIDEFQNFVSLDLIEMLDQVRKFGLFLVMAHQRFGQLHENLIDSVLTNCGIKAVFGGLPVESARVMAQEMFIRDLDPTKVKLAIYQTKFWPKYTRDKVYTSSSSHSSGTSSGESTGHGYGYSTTTGEFYRPGDWFSSTPVGTNTSSGRSSFAFSGRGQSTSHSFSDTDGVADIPIFFPMPFKELSSIEHYTIDEQLWELTAALKEQFERHCFIKIRRQPTQPMLVPFVKSFYTTQRNLDWYKDKLLREHDALAPAEIDWLIAERERALLKAATSEPIDVVSPSGDNQKRRKQRKSARTSIFATINSEYS
jgi:TraM recognition site of TraD and TraG